MNPSTTAITLNMQLPNIATVAWAVQGDQLSRQVTATLVDGSTAWNPQAGYHGVIRAHKPDGTVAVYDVDEDGNPAVTWSGNVATIAIVQQALTAAGTVLMQLEFYDTQEARITAFGWAMNVQPSAVTDNEFLSSDYYNILSLQISGVLGATGHAPYINSNNKNWMVWDENAADYIDSGYSSVGLPGPAPEVTNTSYQYANSTSGTVAPTSWSDTRPATVPGTWAWTKTTITFNDSTTSQIITAAYQGNDGTGAAGAALPLMDGTATVGTAVAYSREDHIHPVDTSRASVADIQYLPMWRGKKALVIGDSWLAGWSGSATGTVTPWSTEFLAMTGLIADLVILSGGGFTCIGSSTDIPPYQDPNTYVSVLDNYQNNDYDIIVVQGGVNDINNTSATVDSIATAIGSFMTKCNTYWPNVPVYYFPTTPFYFLTNQVSTGQTEAQNGKNNKAISLIRAGIANRMLVCKKSARFSLYRYEFRGDITHPSATGMAFFGRLAATFINAGEFPEDYEQIMNDGAAGTYFSPEIAYTQNITSPGLNMRIYDDMVCISLDFTGATSATGQIVTVGSGFPISATNFQNGTAFILQSGGEPICVPAFARQDELRIDLRGGMNMYGKIVTFLITYRTSSL